MIMVKETKKHFIIKKDHRGLNYDLYEALGDKKRIKSKDYNSDNTKQLKISEIINLLKKTPIELD